MPLYFYLTVFNAERVIRNALYENGRENCTLILPSALFLDRHLVTHASRTFTQESLNNIFYTLLQLEEVVKDVKNTDATVFATEKEFIKNELFFDNQ